MREGGFSGPFDRSASFLTSSENVSAPVDKEARARLAVLAATVPNAAASLNPELKAAIATSSATLMASLEAVSPSFPCKARCEEGFREAKSILFALLLRRVDLANGVTIGGQLTLFKMGQPKGTC